MTDRIEEIQDIYQIKVEKYISQGITVDEYLDKILWKEATWQYRFMNYINAESRKNNKNEVVEWQHQVRRD